jgi:hypothetical protein
MAIERENNLVENEAHTNVKFMKKYKNKWCMYHPEKGDNNKDQIVRAGRKAS